MRRALKILVLPIALLGIGWTSMRVNAEHTGGSSTGAKGAKIYCFMRESGNEHEVSWNASYAVIKRQSNNLFKTSPTHAAVMIIESVVQHPDKYENCGSYIGDLFGAEETLEPVNNNTSIEEAEPEAKLESNKSSIKDRYNY